MALNPTMNRAQREAFLAETHVGIFSVSEAGRGPCTVPLWYQYAPGGAVYITMGTRSHKAALLAHADRASLCVQRERLPYKYVSVEGPVEVTAGAVAPYQREIALRYLGDEQGEKYLARFAAGLEDEVLVVLRPERWWAVDFSLVPAL